MLFTLCCRMQAEAVELKLQQEQADKLALQKEVLQLTLVKDEAEAAVKQLREQLADANKALARETAEHQATSAVVSDLRSSLESREQQLGDARQLLDSMSAELGILASRLHRLQQERDALRAARQQDRQARRQVIDMQQHHQHHQHRSPSPQRQHLTACQLEALQPLTGAAAAAAQLQLSALAGSSSGGAGGTAGDPYTTDGSTADSQTFVDCISDGLQPVVPQFDQGSLLLGSSLPRAGSLSAAVSTRHSSPTGLDQSGSSLLALEQHDASLDEPTPLCPHGHLEGACLLCMCQRFLEATAGSCNHWLPGSSLTAAAARISSNSSSGNCLADTVATEGGEAGPSSRGVTPAAAAAGPAAAGLVAGASEAAQYRQYLQISELARNRLEAEHATLQQQVEDLRRQVQQQQQELRVLEAHPAALTACSIEELTSLEGRPQRLDPCSPCINDACITLCTPSCSQGIGKVENTTHLPTAVFLMEHTTHTASSAIMLSCRLAN